METPTRKAGITAKDIGGEVMLYGSDDQAIHILNTTAQVIWNLCDGQHTLAQMEQVMRDRFEVPSEANVLADIQRTLAVFNGKGLLV